MNVQNRCSTLVSLTKVLMPAILATAVVSAQTPSPQRPTPPPTPPAGTPQFRGSATATTIDVYPRDNKGQFISGLTVNDFQLFEDGIEQKITGFAYSNGGRLYGTLATTAPALPVSEGLILPKARPPSDVAGRIFIVFIDDLHLTPDLSPRVKDLLKQVRNSVLHDNDLVGFVSTGYSSIALDLAYDYGHRRMDEVINKVMGAGLTPREMIEMPQGADGLAEVNHNVQVAFGTAYDILEQMEKITGQRKAFIYISSGYMLDPFKDARLKHIQQEYNDLYGSSSSDQNDPNNSNNNKSADDQPYGDDPYGNHSMEFKNADLMHQIAELIRAANRANVMFFTMDPRGLLAGPDSASSNYQLSYPEWRDFVTTTTSTLRVLAEQTGGVAAVETNDFKRALQTIDNMTSDYYMLGYQSSNPDPLKLYRRIEVRLKRPGMKLESGRDYKDAIVLKKPSKRGK